MTHVASCHHRPECSSGNFQIVSLIEDNRALPGRLTLNTRVIIADISVRYAEMITRVSLDLNGGG
jgi:hypothetical protein